jgi:hypothetical protein
LQLRDNIQVILMISTRVSLKFGSDAACCITIHRRLDARLNDALLVWAGLKCRSRKAVERQEPALYVEFRIQADGIRLGGNSLGSLMLRSTFFAFLTSFDQGIFPSKLPVKERHFQGNPTWAESLEKLREMQSIEVMSVTLNSREFQAVRVPLVGF